jgi:hypothetical protein
MPLPINKQRDRVAITGVDVDILVVVGGTGATVGGASARV